MVKFQKNYKIKIMQFEVAILESSFLKHNLWSLIIIAHPLNGGFVCRPERIQVNKDFPKLDIAKRKVCIGLPFFELHKKNFKYHPDSEWSKFLDFLYKSQRFATITCEDWQLFVAPPLQGPPYGFRSVRVHYWRQIETSSIELEEPEVVSTDLVEPEVVQGPAPSFQEWVCEPSLPDATIKIESLKVPKRAIDPTTKLFCQPMLKRPRAECVIQGFGNSCIDASSLSQGNNLQELVAKASEKPKSIGYNVTDISYDISPTVNHISKPLSDGNDNIVFDKDNIACSGGVSQKQVSKPSSQVAWGLVPSSEGWRKKYLAEALVLQAPSSGNASDGTIAEKPSEADSSCEDGLKEMVVNHGAPLSAIHANEDGCKKCFIENAVPTTPFSGYGSGAMEKPPAGSCSIQGGLEEKVPMDPLGMLNGLSNGAMSGASGKEQTKGPQHKQDPINMMALQNSLKSKQEFKNSQAVDKNKGLSNGIMNVSLEKQVPKPSFHGGGMDASSKEQMPKPPSSANGTFQQQKFYQPEAKLQSVKGKAPKLMLPSNPFENSTEQKSWKVAGKLKGITDGPSSSKDRLSQKVSKLRVFPNGCKRSKPKKIKLKKSSIGGSKNIDLLNGFTFSQKNY
jgi:hypothetical protein